MALSPKGILPKRDEDWSDLEATLKANIKFVGDTATIKVSDYPRLTQELIIAEAKKNGYSVEVEPNGFLIFS